MYLKFAKTAARITAAGAVVAAVGLGSAQMALAKPALPTANVPCSAAALSNAISDNTGGETLSLAKFCVYKLTEALPDITEDLTIDGNQGAIERSYTPGTPDFRIFTVDEADLALNRVNLRNGDSGDNVGGAIYNSDGTVTVNGGTFTGNATEDGNDGGAIYNENELRVTGATFTGNDANDGGDGGAIYNDDDATIDRKSTRLNSSHLVI